MLATIYILLLHPHCNSRRKVGFFVLLLDCCSGKRGDKSTLVILSPLLPSLFYSIFCHFKLTTTQYFVFHHITGSWKAKRSEREPHQLKIRKCFLESWQQVIIHFDSAHFYELIKWASSHCFMFLAIPNKNHPKLRKLPWPSNYRTSVRYLAMIMLQKCWLQDYFYNVACSTKFRVWHLRKCHKESW